ncbi:LOW QUALITY PROTEIN: alpha-2-macroglobulin-like protein 1 [Sorex araneus]|uniref:LOW QUALITY PROTEIN: alpha-2-macroglobulin-like protein 1 n=1 Tax=Sorex araneus TaxID=42254 RepID=UPI002433CB2B|nr:LOW QUALITY PROTEIN: alpha-2-macroglobulin-like protein 1 [Sorex araneus]
MWVQLLLGLLALSPVSTDRLPTYLVTLPAQLNFPSTQKVCLDLSPGYYNVKFTITLETKDKVQKLLEHSGLKKRHLHCISFLVPPPAGGLEEVATVRVAANGENVQFEEKKKVLIQRQGNGVFIQTDKPIYSPGQRVNFRIVTLDSQFAPVNEKYSLVELQDPNSNRIAQWLDVVPEQGIVDLSFQLAPETTLGTYTVAVAEGKTFGTFSVEEYVLPKFKIEVVEPKQLSTAEESFLLKICCRYTYGKPMMGAVRVSACQKAHTYWYLEEGRESLPDRCKHLSGQTDKTGCFSAPVDMSTFNLTGYMYSHSVNVVATVVEDGTGNVEANTTQEIYISSQMGSMTFEDTNSFYHPGFPFSGKIRARDHSGTLLRNQELFLVTRGANKTTEEILTTDDDGLASFELDTAPWNATGISLEGRFSLEDSVYDPEVVPRYYQNAYLYLQPFYNTTRSFLAIGRPQGLLKCGQPQQVHVDYDIHPSDASPDQEVIFSYYLMGRGSLELEGQKQLSYRKQGPKGSFSLMLTFTSRTAPDPSLLVYAIFPGGGVIADRVQFSVEMCFENQVSMSFSPSQQLPGAGVELRLQAAPRSLCAVRAVDESVLLLRPERELTNSSVYGLFPFWYGYYPYQVSEYDECPAAGPWDPPLLDPVPEERSSKRSIIWRPWYSEGTDVFRLFQNTGLKVLTNAKIKKPVDCTQRHPKYGASMAGGAGEFSGFTPTSSLPEGSPIRQYFPETWLWDLLPIGSSGEEVVPLVVPDSITEWKAVTFCTSRARGFGLSPPVGLTAFQPFFVDLTLPYSVVRGEAFRLSATVFNYLKECIRVQTELAASDAYRVDAPAAPPASRCLCADEAQTLHWDITAVQLGRINFTVATRILDSEEPCGGQKAFVPEKGRSDTLIKPVLVKPEGVPVEKTHSSLLCPKGKVVSESVSLDPPKDVVPDSTKAYVTVLGDIMGTALQNLDSLVQLPSGCGEQNMVLFLAPIIYVLQYLQTSGLLTEEVGARAVGFLEKGYQQQLLYKHSNGSYSAFGEQDGDGNTWLTAFVTKCFSQAQKFIFIDDKNIQEALKWMAGNQLPSGCFTNVGKLFHTAMKGGVDDEVSLTAYITAALLEMGKSPRDPMVAQGLKCLRNSAASASSQYTQALLAYTFSLAGDMELRRACLEKLDRQAIVSGESIHWSQTPTRASDASPWAQPEAVDVELTAYVLLAWLSKPRLTPEEIARATGVVAWLAKQRNAYGGFASTQDTVVALQALAKYATTAYEPSEEVSVAVKSTGSFQRTFSIQAVNRLVSQQEALPEVPGVYTLEAKGRGCAYVQTVLRYNVFPPKNEETFRLRVDTGGARCGPPSPPRSLTLNVHVSYVGSRGSSNMAIVEVKMLSGFSPAEGTKQLLLQQPLVKKVEAGPDTLHVYLEELSQEPQTYSITVHQSVLVTHLKPAAASIYDYYLPDEQATVLYSDPCEQG